MSLPKILIVGTIPYNPSTQSRSMGSYFGMWEKGKEAIQIFSNPLKPEHGHCSSFYQITDSMMLKAFLHRKKCEGIIYNDSDLDLSKNDEKIKKHRKTLVEKLFSIAKNNKTSFVKLLRKRIWSKKRWLTDSLNNWVESFKPDIIYLAFSNDFFINEIALHFAKQRNIPIVTVIGDDYIFNKHFSLSPFYHIYRKKYIRLVKEIFDYNTGILYTSEKIQQKYTKTFSNTNDIIYISSDFSQSHYSKTSNDIIYIGNLALGRYKSIIDVGECLFLSNSKYKLVIYSPKPSPKILKKISKVPTIIYKGTINYKLVEETLASGRAILITESIHKKDILLTKYSLSTKVSDSLSSGIPILAYGSKESGCIEYLDHYKAAFVFDNKQKLKVSINTLFDDENKIKEVVDNQLKLANKNHRKEINSKIFYDFLIKMLKK